MAPAWPQDLQNQKQMGALSVLTHGNRCPTQISQCPLGEKTYTQPAHVTGQVTIMGMEMQVIIYKDTDTMNK